MVRSKTVKKIAPSDPIERAYMMGICVTDIYVRRLGRQIEVIVGSTRKEIMEIFEEAVGKYTKINSSNTIDKKTGLLMSYRYAILHTSFSFLPSSKEKIPKSEEELYSYIAGAIDGDGNIKFRKRIKTVEGEIRILNTDRAWLEEIKYRLTKYGYHPIIYKNGNEFALSIYRKRDIIKLGSKLLKFMKNETRREKLCELLSSIQIARKPYKRGIVTRDELLKYIKQGLPLSHIAKRFGVHRTTIKYWLKKWNI